MGNLTAAVTPAWAQMNANFDHNTALMSGDSSAVTSAARNASTSAASRRLVPPRHSPTTRLAGPPVWSIIPGSAMVAKMYAAPPTTRSSPRTAASRSSLSTPFCSDTTAVSSPTNGPSIDATRSVSKDFTATTT